MTSMLDKLIGKKVLRIELNEGLVFSINKTNKPVAETSTLIFFALYQLNIYNTFTINGIGTDASIKVLEDLTLLDIEEKTISIVLTFENNIQLIIDLREESFKGPEAACLYGPDNLIAVWN